MIMRYFSTLFAGTGYSCAQSSLAHRPTRFFWDILLRSDGSVLNSIQIRPPNWTSAVFLGISCGGHSVNRSPLKPAKMTASGHHLYRVVHLNHSLMSTSPSMHCHPLVPVVNRRQL